MIKLAAAGAVLHWRKALFLLPFWFLTSLSAIAQSVPFTECATPDPTPAQMARMRTQRSALMARGAQARPTTLEYVPIALHIVRDNAGNGGTPPADVYRALVGANERFAAAGVQFYACGQIDYVDDSTFLAFEQWEEGLLADTRDEPGVLNMYFVQSIQVASGGACGYAYYPGNGLQRLLIACTTIRTVTHELGHAFELIHTHGDGSTTQELVNGANCSTDGDLVCDTPADPYGMSDASATGCNYTGTAIDANGEVYAPHLDNLMSYWACQGRMRPSAEQMARARGAFFTYYDGQLSCGATDPTAPANLTTAAAPGGGRRLTWTDRASNELGYFIERAASAAAPFITVGYTLANGTTWTDPAPPAGAVSYRVKPINAAAAYSNTATYTAPTGAYCIPVNSSPNCAPNLPRYLDRVKLMQGTATIIDNAGSGCGDYTYFAADSGAIVAGTPVSIRLEWPTATAQYAGAWLDLNRDGDFDDANEQIMMATATSSPQMVTFTVPATVTAGLLRLRVRVQNVVEGPVQNPCTHATAGETEDYPVRLRNTCTLAAPTITTNGPLCAGQTLRLTATNVPAGATYAWSGPNNFASTVAAPTIAAATAAATGQYTLTITRNGCSASGTTSATVAATPAQPAALTAQRCGAGRVTFTPPAPPNGVVYRWYPSASATTPLATGNTFNTPNLTASTTYYLSAYRTSGGCESARRAVTATIASLPSAALTANGATTICPGGSVVLTAAGAGAGGSYQFKRNGTNISGATSPTFTATQAGTYTVAVTTAAGCAATSAAVVVTLATLPATPTITRSPQRGDSITLTSSAPTGNQWRLGGTPIPGATARTFVVRRGDPAGPYSVVTTNAAGCISAPATNVSVVITGAAEEQAESQWHLTPNPVRDGWLTLEVPAPYAGATVHVYDPMGRLVRSLRLPGSGSVRLDVRGLAAGVYTLRLAAAVGGAAIGRLVVE